MTKQWLLPAPAKVNLFLHITGRRKDGYHNLETDFQLLDWGDQLRFETSEQIEFSQTPKADFADEQNLVVRAAQLLKDTCNYPYGARMHLQKRLPIGAGLGGGSSDAATTLLALNHIWKTNMDLEKLCQIGLTLGADVPVFIKGISAFATGIGEKLSPIDTPNHWFLVVTPKIHIATKEIFSHPQLTRDSAPIKIRALAAQEGRNDCLNVVETLYPQVAKARKTLAKYAPARLSGTGSSLFAEFQQKTQAEQVLADLANESLGDYSAFIARAVSQSPVHALIAD